MTTGLLTAILGGLLAVGLVLLILGTYFMIWRPGLKLKKKRSTGRMPAVHEKNIFVSDKDLRLVASILSEDDREIRWACRKHWLAYMPLFLLTLLCGVIALIAAIVVATRLGSAGVTIRDPSDGEVRFVSLSFLMYLSVPLVLTAAASVLAAWSQWLMWRAVLLVITDRHLILDTQPWHWAFWLYSAEVHDPVPLDKIISVSHQATLLGNAFGYGTVTVKTLLQDNEDAQFHEMRLVRRHRDFVQFLTNF